MPNARARRSATLPSVAFPRQRILHTVSILRAED
jgi:hypothetical protein